MAGSEAVVCVPVHNEEERLPRLCRALAEQVGLDGRPLAPEALRVVFLLNNCSDRSRQAADAAAARHGSLAIEIVDVVLPPHAAHVGTARRMAMNIGARTFHRAGIPCGALLATDADAIPASDWVAANLAALAEGADVVGGALSHLPDEEARLPDAVRLRGRRLRNYRAALDTLEAAIDPLPYDPAPRHWDHTGASLAIAAATYRRVGGLPPLRCREDLALVAAVRRAGGRVRHCPAVRVQVSARLAGRAAGGMAHTLSAWADAARRGTPVLVEDPAASEARFRSRAALRSLFAAHRDGRSNATDELAAQIGLAPRAMERAVRHAVSEGALLETLVPEPADPPATMPLAGALAAIEARLRLVRGNPHGAT
ncbi:MAG: glycosyltransferase [Alphaproteobacteria bacterium]